MKRSLIGVSLLVFGLIAIAILIRGFDPSKLLPQISEEKLRQAVLTAIQREAPAQFYVTGTLDLSTTAISKSEKVLLPTVLGIDMGTTV